MTDYNPTLHIRNLTFGIIASGAINILLGVSFFYWMVKERPPTPYCELKPATQAEQMAPLASENTNSDLLRTFKDLTMEQLIAKLNETQLVENGYSQRDLALAALVSFHHFDLSRALLGMPQPQQQRSIAYGIRPDGKNAEAIVYPGLTEQQYQAIVQFAQMERWPLTGKGLFLKLRKQKEVDPSLLDAFFLTPEFLTIEMLFNRAEVPVDRMEILAVIKQGNWPMVSKFNEKQRTSQDLTSAKRQSFLLEYIGKESRAAAYLMLKTDGAYAVRKLDDTHIMMMLDLLNQKTQHAEQFALALLTSPRGDAVWKKAASRLYEYAGEPMPDKFQHHAALQRFMPAASVVAKAAPEPAVIKPAEPIVQVLPKPVPTPTPANPLPAPSTPVTPKVTIVRKPTQLPPQGKQIFSSQPVLPIKKERVHVVQDGDTLWKISKRYRVDVDKLKAYNRLDREALKPGTTIRIPL